MDENKANIEVKWIIKNPTFTTKYSVFRLADYNATPTAFLHIIFREIFRVSREVLSGRYKSLHGRWNMSKRLLLKRFIYLF